MGVIGHGVTSSRRRRLRPNTPPKSVSTPDRMWIAWRLSTPGTPRQRPPGISCAGHRIGIGRRLLQRGAVVVRVPAGAGAGLEVIDPLHVVAVERMAIHRAAAQIIRVCDGDRLTRAGARGPRRIPAAPARARQKQRKREPLRLRELSRRTFGSAHERDVIDPDVEISTGRAKLPLEREDLTRGRASSAGRPSPGAAPATPTESCSAATRR